VAMMATLTAALATYFNKLLEWIFPMEKDVMIPNALVER